MEGGVSCLPAGQKKEPLRPLYCRRKKIRFRRNPEDFLTNPDDFLINPGMFPCCRVIFGFGGPGGGFGGFQVGSNSSGKPLLRLPRRKPPKPPPGPSKPKITLHQSF